MPLKKQFTVEEKQQIMNSRLDGLSFKQIADKYVISKSVANKIYQNFQNGLSIVPRIRQGLPKLYGRRLERAKLRICRENSKKTSEDIVQEIINLEGNIKISTSTIRKILYRNGMKSY